MGVSLADDQDDSTQEIHVTLDSGHKIESNSDFDPFSISGNELLNKYDGFAKNTTRRMKYKINKFVGLEGDDKSMEPSKTYFKGNEGSRSKQLNPLITAYDILEAAIPPYDPLYLSRLYDKSPYNYAAINAKAANVIGLGFRLDPSPSMELKLEGITDPDKLDFARKKLKRLDMDMHNWLNSLNNIDLFTQILRKAFVDYQATGNGYIEVGRIEKGPNKGQIGYLGHIPSSTVRVRRKHDGFVQMVNGRVRYFRPFQELSLDDPLGDDPNPNEIIHLKNYSPTNTYYGVPDIVAALNAVAGTEFAARFNLDFFEHRAAPRYVIIAKGANLSKTSQAQMLEFLQSGLKGKNHRSIYVPLPPDRDGVKTEFTLQPVENSVQDSSFDNYRTANRDEILSVHRVPLSKIASTGANVATAFDADKTFKETVCRPEQDILEQRINRVIAEKTDVFVLKFNELTLTDELQQAQIDTAQLTHQMITPNEARAKHGMGPLPSGDEVVQLKPQQQSEQAAQAGQTRARDKVRQTSKTDANGMPRNAKGTGSKTPPKTPPATPKSK